MIKSYLYIFCFSLLACPAALNAQSMHFSQYYNAPMLLNPANTALLPDNDFRLGANYRNQWAVIPVPYNTFSAWGDFKVGGKGDCKRNNWLGLGLAFFNDQAGNGNLSLTQIQGDIAYHLRLGEHSLFSLGFSGANVTRSVNIDKLSFDMQWDGEQFNTTEPNGEKINGILKTSYATIGVGGHLAVYPNENTYMQFSGGALNINQPTESFYNRKNKVGIRPIADIDMLFRTGDVLIINPSMYYTTQNAASELVAGAAFRIHLSSTAVGATELILGVYDRLNDAIIGAAGCQYSNIQFMASYDFTTSLLTPYNGGYGALEFSIIYKGNYHRGDDGSRQYTCPRFD